MKFNIFYYFPTSLKRVSVGAMANSLTAAERDDSTHTRDGANAPPPPLEGDGRESPPIDMDHLIAPEFIITVGTSTK